MSFNDDTSCFKIVLSLPTPSLVARKADRSLLSSDFFCVVDALPLFTLSFPFASLFEMADTEYLYAAMAFPLLVAWPWEPVPLKSLTTPLFLDLLVWNVYLTDDRGEVLA